MDIVSRGLITGAVAFIGSAMTRGATSGEDSYYDRLIKKWAPPKWLFGLMWTIIYITYVVVWVRASRNLANKCLVDALFLGSLLLNLLWSYFFFGMGSMAPVSQSKELYKRGMFFSKIVIILLFLVVAYQAYIMYKSGDYLSTGFLGIYLAWLCVATYLNFTVRSPED